MFKNKLTGYSLRNECCKIIQIIIVIIKSHWTNLTINKTIMYLTVKEYYSHYLRIIETINLIADK